jgi:hypothetical protein
MLKIYDEYQKYGVDGYYKSHNRDYSNPHSQKIEDLYINHLRELIGSNISYSAEGTMEPVVNILDIACGDGLIAQLVNKYNNNCTVEGTDPYFNNKYTTYNYSFEDISMGKLQKNYHIAICCYAFHLINPQWMFNFLDELANITNTFVIITPSKKININHPYWRIFKEMRIEKVTLMVLKTNQYSYIK